VACTRIAKGKGVCGAAWLQNKTLIVPDVEKFPGHIACSALSKSEIVVPVRKKTGEILGVLDIDSSSVNDFSTIDQTFLESWIDIWVEASHV
jgi:GAF domain-containing protein